MGSPGGFPTHAYVFADRVVDLAKEQMVGWTGLLGTMVAHEVGHLLLGDNSHFPTGIMSAGWRNGEVKRALVGNPKFTSTQAEQICADIRRRMKGEK